MSFFDFSAFLTLPADMSRAAADGWRRGWNRSEAAPAATELTGFAAFDRVATEMAPPTAG